MNNTIIRLAVSTAGSLRILYAHMLPLFRRERAYTREQMTASMKGIKKKILLLSEHGGPVVTCVFHFSALRTRPRLSPRSRMRARATTDFDLSSK